MPRPSVGRRRCVAAQNQVVVSLHVLLKDNPLPWLHDENLCNTIVSAHNGCPMLSPTGTGAGRSGTQSPSFPCRAASCSWKPYSTQ